MLKERLKDYFSEIGDLGFGLGVAGMPPVSTFPQEWLNEYVDKNYQSVDPIIRWAAMNVGWTTWADIEQISLGEKRFMERAARCGFENGTVISIYRFNSISSISLCHSKKFLEEQQVEEATEALRCYINLYQESPPSMDIKARLFLRHAAAGLDTSEIAERMSCSASSVSNHRKNAMKQLNAKNVAQAVARAIELGVLY